MCQAWHQTPWSYCPSQGSPGAMGGWLLVAFSKDHWLWAASNCPAPSRPCFILHPKAMSLRDWFRVLESPCFLPSSEDVRAWQGD